MKKPVVLKATEHEEQVAFFQWCYLMAQTNRFPQLLWAFAIPNGGARHIVAAMKLKGEGVKPGVPDIFIPVPMNGFHGLFIEMKRCDGGKVSEQQATWLSRLSDFGYKCVLANGWEEAKKFTEIYLK